VFKNMNVRSRQQRTDDRRSAIVQSAQGAIRELGLKRAGMREIARAAGLSAGNLYYYFRNKHELVYFCQDQTLDRLLEVVKQAHANRSAAAALETIVRGHLTVLLDPATAGAVHLDFEDLPKPLLKKLVEKRDRYERAVRAVMEEGQRHGQIFAGDPKVQTFVLLGALNWAARWFNPSGPLSVEDVAEVYVPQLLKGLLP
jgi:AcrR family transcriptional regulator